MRKRDLIITTLVVLLIWQTLAMLLQRDILPTPIAVAQAFVANLGEIAKHFVASGFRVIASIVIAVVAGRAGGSGHGADSGAQSNLFAAGLHHLSHPQDRVLPDHPVVSGADRSRPRFSRSC